MKIGVLKLAWNAGPNATAWDPWPDDFLETVFNGPEPWSLRSFWRASTFGLVEPVFDLDLQYNAPAAPGMPAGWRTWPYGPGTSAGATIADALAYATAHGLDTTGYGAFSVLVHPPPSPASGGVVFDFGGFSLDFYVHEIGHLVGFQHAFGSPGIRVYQDPYCVMGYSFSSPNPPAHAIAPAANAPASGLAPGFWVESRRFAVAQAYRHLPAFSTSTSVRQAVNPATAESDHAISAASDGTLGSSLLLVRLPVEPPTVAGPGGELLFEYRRPKPGDADAGLAQPTVVVHSIGLQRNQVLPGQGEVRPTWFEGALPAEPGERWNDPQHDVGIEVIAGSSQSPGPATATIRVGRRKPPLYEVAFDPINWLTYDLVLIETGAAIPPPTGFCTFSKPYPYETSGVRESVRLHVTTKGFVGPVVAWDVHGHSIPTAPGTDVTIQANVSATGIRGGVSVKLKGKPPQTWRRKVDLRCQVGADQSLTITKGELDGAFELEVFAVVSGSYPSGNPYVARFETAFTFSPDVLHYGGGYSDAVSECFGDFPVLWPIPFDPWPWWVSDPPGHWSTDDPLLDLDLTGGHSRWRPTVRQPAGELAVLPSWIRSIRPGDEVEHLIRNRLDLTYRPDRRLAAIALGAAGLSRAEAEAVLDGGSQRS